MRSAARYYPRYRLGLLKKEGDELINYSVVLRFDGDRPSLPLSLNGSAEGHVKVRTQKDGPPHSRGAHNRDLVLLHAFITLPVLFRKFWADGTCRSAERFSHDLSGLPLPGSCPLFTHPLPKRFAQKLS